jgi:DNA-binding LacI/PurR family transcriptional regulator
MLGVILKVVGSNNDLYVRKAYKELSQMDHRHILVLLLPKIAQAFQDREVAKQQFHRDCNYNQV